MGTRAFSFVFISIVSFGSIAGVRDELYGPRYKPLWEKNAKTKFPKSFGPSTIRALTENAGFIYENYTVRTEDDYLINLNRMVHPSRVGEQDKGYPILLLNGLVIQSEAWFLQTSMDANLAPVWSALGYDVWSGDQRGTIRSRGHITLNADRDSKYWDFGSDETSEYDTAAFVDFILKKTGHKDLVILCVSFGCSMHAGLLDSRPEYNEKIRGAFYFNALVNNIRKELDMKPQYVSSMLLMDLFTRALEHRNITEVVPRMTGFKKEVYHICFPFRGLILPITKLIENGNFHATELFCRQFAISVGGGSVKSFRHVLQQYERGEFIRFDYGREENSKRYGQEAPPLYDLSKIKTFVAVYYSDGDGFTSPQKTEQLTLKSLGGPTYGCLVPSFHHNDFAIGETLKYVLPDVNAVLDSLTGLSNDTQKALSGKCPSMEWVRKLQY